MKRSVFPLFVTLFVTASLAAANPKPEETWPGFRGHRHERRSRRAASVPEKWSATENVRWKVDVPGQGWSSPIVWGDTVFLTAGISSKPFKQPTPGLYGNEYIAELQRQGLSGEEVMRRVRARDNESPEESDEIRYMVYALDAAHRQDQVGAGGAQGQALRRPAPQEHLRVRNAVHRRRAALRVVRPERRPLLLHARRHAALEEAVAAAAHLPRLRHRLVTDRARRPRLPAARQRGRFLHHRARCQDRRRDSGARSGPRPASRESSWTTPFVWKNEKRTEIVTLGHAMVLSYGLDGKELWRVTGMSMPTASPIACQRLALRRQRLAGRRQPSVPRHQARRDRRHHARRRRRRATTSSPGGSRASSGYTPSALVHDGRAYLVHDTGILAVLNAKTGAADLQGPRRRRRAHVLGLARRRRQIASTS